MMLVGVTQAAEFREARGEHRDSLDRRWCTFLDACGLACLPVPNHPALALRVARTAEIGALVLTGGQDLVEYGGDSPARDETERTLVSWARRRGLPILGVCRGMEHLLTMFGVALRRVEGHAGTRHSVEMAGVSRVVNSYHRWAAFGPLPDPLLPVAIHEGTIEAMRHRHEAILGVMWHPEREAPFDPADIAGLGTFLKGAT